MNLALFKDVIYNWVGLLGNIIYGFFMIPYIIKTLGDTDYGIWNLIMSVVGFVSILDFGIQSSINRYVSKYKAVNNIDGVNGVYSTAIAIYTIIASGAIIIGITSTLLFMNKAFNFPIESYDIVIWISIIMVIFSSLELPFSVFGAILYAYQRFDLINLVAVVALAFRSILLIWILNYNSNLQVFCYIIVLVGISNYAVNFILAHQIVGSLRFKLNTISRDLLGHMFRFSSITFCAIIVNSIIFKTDNIIIGVFLDPKAITMYSVGFMLTEYGAQLIGKMCNTLTPRFSELHTRDELQELNSLLLVSTRYSILIGIPLGLTVLVIGNEFIQLWLGLEYVITYNIMAILMCARMCGFPTAPLYSMLYGIGLHRLILYTGITEAILNLGLSIFLVQKIGITGVAWGTFIPMLICNILFLVMVLRKINLSLMIFIKKAMLRPLIFSTIYYVAICIFKSTYNLVWTQISWHTFIIKAVCIISIYVMIFIFIGLEKREREQLKWRFSKALF